MNYFQVFIKKIMILSKKRDFSAQNGIFLKQ